MEYGGLQPILPFLEGRSDAACRVVIRLHAVPQRFLQRRGTPHRFPPSRLPPMGTYGLNRAAARHVATNAPPRLPTLPPTCALPSPYLGRCPLGFHAKIRGCSGPGRAMVGRRYGGIRGEWVGAYRIARFAHMVGECICSDVACRVAINNHRFAINNHRVD